ncbi:MAG: lysoplasmalogenase family protein, partial [Coprobacillus sp.]
IMLISLSYLPKMDYKKMRKPVFIYAFMIAWATSRSVAVYIMMQTPMFLCIMIGFILYFISDFILLFDRFYDHQLGILRVLNLLTYYSGMFLIAYSLF